MLYKATEHGFSKEAAISKVFGRNQLVLFLLSENGETFGCSIKTLRINKYTLNNSEDDRDAFIFQLNKRTILHQKESRDSPAANFERDDFLSIGEGPDIHICKDPNINRESYCNLGETFKISVGNKMNEK